MDTGLDAIFNGHIVVEQPTSGYRFGIDALLLGAGAPNGTSILDAGCAVGVVAMACAHHQPDASITGVEVQSRLASLARSNAVRNGRDGQIEIIESDLRQWSGSGFDLILMNPPFFATGAGGLNPNKERNAARHEVHGSLVDLCRAVSRSLGLRGCLRVIFPAEQTLRLLSALQGCGLKVSRLRAVHSFADSPAKLVLVDARNHGRRELEIAPPLVIYDEPDRYTDTMQDLLEGVRVVL